MEGATVTGNIVVVISHNERTVDLTYGELSFLEFVVRLDKK
jgi:hypothetical protein